MQGSDEEWSDPALAVAQAPCSQGAVLRTPAPKRAPNQSLRKAFAGCREAAITAGISEATVQAMKAPIEMMVRS
jgi:hypothetical protein